MTEYTAKPDYQKKVLIVIPTPLAFKQFLLDISLLLIKKGFEVHVACVEYSEKEYYSHDIQYHFIDIDRHLNPWKTYKAIAQLREVVKNVKPHIIHAHFSSSAFLLSLSKKKDFPICMATIQGAISTSNGLGWKKWVYFPFELFALRSMDRSFVLTDDDYVKLKPYTGNLEIQYTNGFGVDLEVFKPREVKEKELLRRELNISIKDFVIIYVGRLVSFKGFGLVLESFKDLLDEFNHVKLLVCGAPDKHREMGLNEKQQKIWEQGENIIKIGFTSELPKYLAMADINFFPSTREGKPVNLMESIATGIPCITSNFRGCRHVVLHNVNGLIVRKHNSKSYLDVIKRVLIDKALIKKLIDGCNKTRMLYDRNLFFEELLHIYSEELNQNV